jgi:hypothetical protein
MTTENFSTSPLSIVGGQPFTFSVYLNSGESLRATVECRDEHGSSISTNVTNTVGVGGTASVTATAPDHAVQAVITVSVTHDQQRSFFSGMNFGQQLPGALEASSLSLTAPTYIGSGKYYTGTTLGVTSTTASGRLTDDHQYAWETPVGNYQVGGFAGGTAWPLVAGARSVAILPGQVNCNVGVTFRSAPPVGMTQGVIFRYTNDSNYWRAGRTLVSVNADGTPNYTSQLQYKQAGAWTTVGTFVTQFDDNDRLVVQLGNGSNNSINVFRNGGNLVYATSNSFNATATPTYHGLVVET